MPLPLGHAAIGLTVCDLFCKNYSIADLKKSFLFILILANLPDLDVVLGLFVQGNGNIFHHGPTHSILFALVGGVIAANTRKLWARIPKLSAISCFLIILSHTLADVILGDSTVALFWPFESYYSDGHRGWEDVMELVIFGSFQEVKIIASSISIIIIHHFLRRKLSSKKKHKRKCLPVYIKR